MKGHTAHVKVPMNALLENYVTLKKDPRVIEHDNDVLRSLEEKLRENPNDAVAVAALTLAQQKLMAAYRSVLACLVVFRDKFINICSLAEK